MKRFHITLSLSRLIVLAAALGITGVVGSGQLGHGAAATSYSHNPTGYVDRCVLSGTTTVFYGWAYDPDAPAGAQPYINLNIGGGVHNAASSISGYRDAPVKSYINSHYPGAPTPGTYGWTVSVAGLYKGTSYSVGGTVLNYGAGSSSALGVNTFGPTDGNASYIYFPSSSIVPDACMSTRPPTPTPPPSPTPSPTPGPSRNPPPSGTPTPPASTPAAAPTADANAVVATGTTSAVLAIPAGNATKMHLTYSFAGGPALNTDDQAVSGDNATVNLTDLQATTDYGFQIVRTNADGASATSPSATFTTLGYTLQLRFINSQKKPIAGVVGSITNASHTSATSDKSGVMAFNNLSSGVYTINYTYKGLKHAKDIDTGTSTGTQIDDKGAPKTLVLSDAINVDKLAAAGSTKSSGHGPLVAIATIIVVIILLAAAIWFVLRWRRNRSASNSSQPYPSSSPLAPTPQPVYTQAPVQPAASAQTKTHTQPVPAPPLPTHAGESLREMVLESMRNQNAQQPAAAAEQPLPAPIARPTPLPTPLPLPVPLQPQHNPTVLPTPLPSTVAKPLAPKHAISASPKPPDDGQTIRIQHNS